MFKVIKTFLSITALLGFFAQVNASDLFVIQSDTALKSKNGKIAKLFIGVPVQIIKNDTKSVEVSVQGYKFDDLNVYSTKGKELLIATLDEGFEVIKKEGNQVELLGSVSKDLLSNDIEGIWEEQQEFYYDMCSVCHAAPQIPHHTMMEWEALFTPMVGFAKLEKEEAAELLRFIKSISKNGLVKAEH